MTRTSRLVAAAALLSAGLFCATGASAEWGGGYGGTPGVSTGSGYGGNPSGTGTSGGTTWGGNRGTGASTWGNGGRGTGSTWGGGSQPGYGGGNVGSGGGRPIVGYGGARPNFSNCYYCRTTPDVRFPTTYPIRPRPPVWNQGGYPVGYGGIAIRPQVGPYLGRS